MIESVNFNNIQKFNVSPDIDCGELPSFEHGAIILPEHRTSYGALATYTCHENYTLIGNENRTCDIDGWSGKQPQCLVDWCPDPVQIAGGQVEMSGKRAGATAVYKCDPGYVLIGDPVGILDDYEHKLYFFYFDFLSNGSFGFFRSLLVVWVVNGAERHQFVDMLTVVLQ